MRSATIALCLALSASLRITALHAEEPEFLRPGTRLRVTAPAQAPKRVVGTLTAVDPSLLTIQTSRERITVRREAIQKVEVSERRGWKRRGALIGAGVGVVAAVIIAGTDEQKPFCFLEPCSGDPLFSRESIGLAAAILFVPIGAGLGAVVAPGDRWVEAKTPILATGHLRGGGLHLGIRLSF